MTPRMKKNRPFLAWALLVWGLLILARTLTVGIHGDAGYRSGQLIAAMLAVGMVVAAVRELRKPAPVTLPAEPLAAPVVSDANMSGSVAPPGKRP